MTHFMQRVRNGYEVPSCMKCVKVSRKYSTYQVKIETWKDFLEYFDCFGSRKLASIIGYQKATWKELQGRKRARRNLYGWFKLNAPGTLAEVPFGLRIFENEDDYATWAKYPCHRFQKMVIDRWDLDGFHWHACGGLSDFLENQTIFRRCWLQMLTDPDRNEFLKDHLPGFSGSISWMNLPCHDEIDHDYRKSFLFYHEHFIRTGRYTP